jgi:hypothetical protein
MCKKLIFLISFVLVLSLGRNVLALDLVMPDFAGGGQTAAVLWEFEEGNSVTAEASDQPSLILYDPEPPDACFGFRYAGFSYTGEEDPNLAFFWDSNGTVVVPEEESLIQPVPDGEGDNLTVQVQIMWWNGPNTPNGPGDTPYLAFAIETWEGKGVEAEEGGEWVDGIGNEEGLIDLSPIAEVSIAPGWKHTTYRHTFEDFSADIDVTHVHILFFGYEHGTSGLKLDEVVVDMVVHDGADPEEGPGRLWLRIPRAGQARNPVPAQGAEHVRPDTNLSWAPDPCLAGPLTYDVWFGTDPNMANNAKIASNIGDSTVDPCAGDLADATVYYWRVDTNDANGGGTPVLHTGLDWQFTTWGLADDPEPRNGETGAETSTDLSWVKDDYADSFDVYFGTSYTDVNDATTSTAGIYRGGSTGTWVDPCDANNVRYLYDIPGILDMLKQCYWRIDEINTPKAATIKGNIWTFRTEAHLDLEDFDSYASTEDLYTVWNDYWVNDSDAEIGLMKNPDYVQSGYALQLDYENTSKSIGNYVGSFTDADVADLEGGTDWTVSGIKALVLHFLGQPGNQATANEKMWVEIEDTSSNVGLVLYDGDPNDVQVPSWHEWNVDLGIFDACGVTLSAVSKIRIGFGGEIRTGQSAASLDPSTVYFDELELHPIRCVPAVSWPYGDIDGDCNVGGYDLEAMSADWLVKDYEVIPVPPDRNNLLVEYLFDTDGNYNDTSGSGLHGQPTASLTSVAGGYLTIENTGGYVEIPFGESNPFHGPTDFSIFINYRSDTIAVTGLMTSTDPCLPTDWDDPNVVDIDEVFTTYSPMAVIVDQAHTGSSSAPDDITFYYDNWFKGGTNVAKSEIGGIGSWHSVAVTYDADGGTCPDEPWDPNACPPGSVTGLFTVYIDGTKGPDPANYDPNIPVDANHDIVRIGDGYNPLHPEDWGFTTHIGDINEILIYDVALTEGEVYYLSGITDPTYVANTSVANVVPKSPPGGPYDANNMDIINFLDYEKLAERWLTGPYLWP